MTKLLKQVESRKLKIQNLQSEIVTLQSQCPHENAEIIAKGDSGNWDYSESYWVDVNCKDCLAYFSIYEDENRELYLQYLNTRKK